MTAVVIAIIGAVGVVAGGIITALFTRRRTSAEAGKIITDAAAGVVEILRTENTRVLAETHAAREEARMARDEARLARQESSALAVRERQTRDMVVAHTMWDQQAKEIAADHGIELPPVPPLYPPDE